MMSPDEKRLLLARVLAGNPSPEDLDQLAAACRAEPELLGELHQQTLIDRLLAHTQSYPDAEAFTREVEARVRMRAAQPKPAEFVKQVTWRLRWRQWLPRPALVFGLAAAALAVAVTVWFRVITAPVAQVERIESATWPAGQKVLSLGEGLDRGRVAIGAGFLELRMESGVKVILEGPADIELRQRNACFLRQGRAVISVPASAKGFVLESEHGRLVDMGTEFGVSVDRTGALEVHVLKGSVEATPTGKTKSVRVQESEAVRLADGAVVRMVSNPLEFVTDLPAHRKETMGFVHWSFDEGEGELVHNDGHGLGPTNSDAAFRTFDDKSHTPAWSNGQFGNGLYFDGKGGYLETAFTGIAGDHPRTVAFWMKVPHDLKVQEGYGIINWGSQNEPGAAWQISINPIAAEGPVGHLRVGVHNAPVVGVTDLRDDRWHHCAVVMYGGHRPDLSTHVLLYLDGELEPAAAKAVCEIHTDTASDVAHGIWVGRNISFRTDPKKRDPVHRFFRGWLDEIFIFDHALSQEQIRELMRDNHLSQPPP